MSQPICKFCKTPWPDFAELKFHCETDHQAEYQAIARWIGRTVIPRLETIEKLAQEGMAGANDTADR